VKLEEQRINCFFSDVGKNKKTQTVLLSEKGCFILTIKGEFF